MDTVVADLRHALRTLRRTPAFTFASLATLALGIGATASIFSVVNGVLLRPLAVPDPDRIVIVRTNQVQRGWIGVGLTGPEFAAVRAQTRAFEHITATIMQNAELTGRGDPAEVTAAIVSKDFFSVMPVSPLVGRTFHPAEFEGAQARSIVLVGEGMWRSRFGADPAIVGGSITVNGTPRTVVGVVPAEASWPRPAGSPDLFFALGETFETMDPGAHMLEVVARLRPGATIEQVRAELGTVDARLAREFPASSDGWTLSAARLHDEVVGPLRRALLILLAAVGFVLLIVCVNIAGLLVARTSARAHEIAIRRALGASRGRVIRHLVAESIVLTVGGGLLGVLFALWGVDLLRAAAAETLPRVQEVAVDGRVLVFTAGLTALAGILCSLAPAFTQAAPDVQKMLKEGGRTSVARRRWLGRDGLVVAEIALALVLLSGAGLMARSFAELRRIPLGFDPQLVLAVDLDLPRSRYEEPARRDAVIKGIEERLRSLPGIVGVGTTRALPLESGGPDVEFTIDGRAPVAAGELGPRAFSTAVTPDYFGAMRMRVVRGRALTPADDRAGAPRVIVINETLARRFWSGENPVGRSITLPGGEKAEIVGIVADIRQRFLTNAVEPQMFVAWAHAPETQASIVVRGAGDPTALVDAIRREVWAVDPLLPVEEWTLDSLLEQTLGAPRFQTLLLLAFASAALLLAAMGVYALVSYAVAQRTREIGVRMALGARRPDVLRMVLRQGIALTTAGVSLGILGALSLTRLLEKVLYGVSTTDPPTHAAAALFLATIAILATYLPARRATEVDPVVALRSE